MDYCSRLLFKKKKGRKCSNDSLRLWIVALNRTECAVVFFYSFSSPPLCIVHYLLGCLLWILFHYFLSRVVQQLSSLETLSWWPFMSFMLTLILPINVLRLSFSSHDFICLFFSPPPLFFSLLGYCIGLPCGGKRVLFLHKQLVGMIS